MRRKLGWGRKAPDLRELEREALECMDRGEDANQIIKEKKNPFYTRLFSPLRANCIHWLPFEEGDAVIDFGAGYGEFCAMLAARCCKVFSYEGNPAKAPLLAKRCEGTRNIEIAADFDSLLERAQGERIRYIFIHNLEGSDSDKKAFASQLRTLAQRFAGATAVVLCGNRLGIRYWAGAYDDHYGQYTPLFEGNDKMLFARQELAQLLDQAGYGQQMFYYPFPDHVFTRSIFSERFLPDESMLTYYRCTWEDKYARAFDENKALRELCREGLFTEFNNSFLVIAQTAPSAETEELPVFAKFSDERLGYLAIETLITKDKEVIKRCYHAAAQGHIRKMHDWYPALQEQYRDAGIVLTKPTLGHREVRFPYVEGKSFTQMCKEAVADGDFERLLSLAKTFRDRVEGANNNGYFSVTPEFTSIFGAVELPDDLRCGTYNNIDLIFDNIIVDADGQWNMIDYEWVFAFPIPAKYILFRSMFTFLARQGKWWEEEGWKRDCWDLFGITHEMGTQFLQMERSFQRYITEGIQLIRELPRVE